MLAVSWSGLQRFEGCHQRHKLVIAGKSIKAKDIRVFFPGKVSDLLMRAWLNLSDPPKGWMLEHVEEFAGANEVDSGDGIVRWRGPTDKPVVLNQIRDIVTKLEPILYRLVIPYPYQPEYKFSYEMNVPYLDGNLSKISLIGGIDIVVERPEGIVLMDLKATYNDSYIYKTLGQSHFYSLAWSVGWHKPPVLFAFVQPGCKQQVVPVQITDQHRAEIAARIIRMAHSMWQKDFKPKQSNTGCNQCEVKHACEKFAYNLVGGKKTISLGGP